MTYLSGGSLTQTRRREVRSGRPRLAPAIVRLHSPRHPPLLCRYWSNQSSGSSWNSSACQLSTRARTNGSASIARSSARAGPCGRRRPFSQFRKVSRLIPTSVANCFCVAPNFARMRRTSSEENSTLALPRRARLSGCFTCASGSASGFRGRLSLRPQLERIRL